MVLTYSAATAIRDYRELHNLPPVEFNEVSLRKLRLQRWFPEIKSLPHEPFASHCHFVNVNSSGADQTDVLRSWLRRHLPVSLTYSAEERLRRPDEYDRANVPHEVSGNVDGLARFMIAFSGGAFLVVPMLVMIFNPSLVKSVITVCVAVLLFAAVLAFCVRAGNAETLASTATYAAFLVVFVGTNTGG